MGTARVTPLQDRPESRSRTGQGPPGSTGSRRRGGYIAAAIVLSVLGGVGVARFHPLFVFGVMASILAAYIVVTMPFIGLLLYTILYWWRPGELYPPVSGLHLERVVGALALVGMFLEQYQRERRLFIDGTRQTKTLFLTVLLVVISAVYAYSPSLAINEAIDFIKLVVLYLLIVHMVNTRSRWWLFLGLWLACVGKTAFDSLRAYFFGGWAQYTMGIKRAIGQNDAGGDPNALAVTMSATIPILLLLSFHKPLRWARIPAALLAVLLTVTMALTGSRSGLIGFFSGLLFLWWRGRRRLVTGLCGLAIIGAGLVVLPDQYKTRYATIGSKQIDSSSQGRLDVWKVGLRMVADHPVTGIGIGCFSLAHAERYSPEFQENPLIAHSLYVGVLAELGVCGALVFFAFVFGMLRLNRRAGRALGVDREAWQGESLVLRGMAAGVFCLLLTGVFGTSYTRPTWYVYAAVAAAVMRIHAEGLNLDAGTKGTVSRWPEEVMR